MSLIKARQFPGGTSTDSLASASDLQFAQLTSYYFRFKLISLDSTQRQLFKWTNEVSVTLVNIPISSTVFDIIVQSPWASLGDWTITVPSTGVEHDLVITYDSALTTNKPVVYLDGSTVTVTTVTTPTGTPVFTGVAPIRLGNNKASGGTISLNHWQDLFAIWRNIILNQTDVTNLHNGTAPCAVQSANLAFYAPMDVGQSPEPELVAGNNLTVTGTTIVDGTSSTANPRCTPPRVPLRYTLRPQ